MTNVTDVIMVALAGGLGAGLAFRACHDRFSRRTEALIGVACGSLAVLCVVTFANAVGWRHPKSVGSELWYALSAALAAVLLAPNTRSTKANSPESAKPIE